MRRIAALLVLVLVVPALVALTPTHASAEGLVLHLDAAHASGVTIPDLTGRGGDGTLLRTQALPHSGLVGNGTASAPRAVAFDGEDDMVQTASKVRLPPSSTLAVWFRTYQGGGKIVGFETAQVGGSSNYDRALVLGDDGRLHFLAYRRDVGWATLSTEAVLADGRWHLVVAASPAEAGGTMRLYVDGTLAASREVTGTPSSFEGYWRLGGGTTSGAPERVSNIAYWGHIASLRVYDRELSADEAAALAREGPVGDARAWSAAAPRPTFDEALALHLAPARAAGDGIPDASPRANHGLLRHMAGSQSGATGDGSHASPHAIAFDGVDDLLATEKRVRAPDSYSIQVWFNATSPGGKLAGIETNQGGPSGDHDRTLYLTDDGRVGFSVRKPGGGTATLASKPGNADARWHHVVATKDLVNGMRLYLDGRLIVADGTHASHPMHGYWRFGEGGVAAEDAPRQRAFRGLLGEVSVHERPLGPEEVAALHALGPDASAAAGRVETDPTIPPPTSQPGGSVNEGTRPVSIAVKREPTMRQVRMSVQGESTLVNVTGCTPMAAVMTVEDAAGVARKHLGAIGLAPCAVHVHGPSPKLLQWIQASLGGADVRHEVVLSQLETGGSVVARLTLQDAIIMGVEISQLDGATWLPSIPLTLVLDAAGVVPGAAPGCCPAEWSGGKAPRAVSFRVDAVIAAGIGPIVWTRGENGAYDVADVLLVVPESKAAAFAPWAEAFLLAGTESERTIVVELLANDMKTPVRSITLSGVGVAGGDVLGPRDHGKIMARTYRLYVETISIS